MTKKNIFNTTKKFISDVIADSKGSIEYHFVHLQSSLYKSRNLDTTTKHKIIEFYKSTTDSIISTRDKAVNRTVIVTNAVLATDFSRNMSRWLETITDGVPTAYDQALDATYNATNIGGGKLHRLFDESHTPWNAWDKSQGVLSDDTNIQEIVGYTQAMIKDLSTEVGIPLVDLTPDTYHKFSGAISDNFGIPKDWTSDLLHYNGVEVIVTSIGVLALALNWNKEDITQFSSLAGGLGISSLASANPLLGVVTLVSLAKSFTDARRSNNYSEFVNGLVKGGVGSGVIIGTSAIIGGPVWIGVVSGMCVGVCAQKAMDRVEVLEIADYVQQSMQDRLANQNLLIRFKVKN